METSTYMYISPTHQVINSFIDLNCGLTFPNYAEQDPHQKKDSKLLVLMDYSGLIEIETSQVIKRNKVIVQKPTVQVGSFNI